MAKQIIPLGLLNIPPEAPDSAYLALKLFWTVCARCSVVHVSSNRSWPGIRSTQGYGCASSVSSDGSKAHGSYGSNFDDVYFAIESSAREAIKGADPLCDACLAALTLDGLAFPFGWWVELSSPPGAPDMPPGDTALCAQRELQTFLELLAARRGRQSI